MKKFFEEPVFEMIRLTNEAIMDGEGAGTGNMGAGSDDFGD